MMRKISTHFCTLSTLYYEIVIYAIHQGLEHFLSIYLITYMWNVIPRNRLQVNRMNLTEQMIKAKHD